MRIKLIAQVQTFVTKYYPARNTLTILSVIMASPLNLSMSHCIKHLTGMMEYTLQIHCF